MDRLFAGLVLTSKLKEQLNQVKKPAEIYFRFDDPKYLQIVSAGGNSYLGKWIETPYSLDAMENLHRNINSIVKLILPNNRISSDQYKVFALPDEDETTF